MFHDWFLQLQENPSKFYGQKRIAENIITINNTAGEFKSLDFLIHKKHCYFLVVCFTCVPLISLSYFIEAHDPDLSVGVRLLSGETLLQVKNFTGRRWDLNPGPYCKRANPLHHLQVFSPSPIKFDLVYSSTAIAFLLLHRST